MSEFSAGIMLRSNFKELALKYMEKDSFLIQLNEQWLCRLSKNDFCSTNAEANYTEAVLNLSEHIPLLHIINSEDHGFEIGIMYNKKIAFSCNVNYEDKAASLFSIGAEQIGKFQILGYSQEHCDKIQEIFSIENHQKDSPAYHLIEELLNTLGLSEFSFISYNYILKNVGKYTIYGNESIHLKEESIKKIIGEVLEPEGFVYNKKLGWGFLKKFKNCNGEAAAQAVKFYSGSFRKSLCIEINCFSGGFSRNYMRNFVPNCFEDEIEYSKDEDFLQVVEKYADILKQYGLSFLKKLEKPQKKYYFRQEDYNKLFSEHEVLADKFIAEQDIDMEHMTIEEGVELIRELLLRKKSDNFSDIRELILEMAAFYGRAVSQKYACKWIMEDEETYAICTLKVDLKNASSFFVTNTIYCAWNFKKIEKLDNLLI